MRSALGLLESVADCLWTPRAALLVSVANLLSLPKSLASPKSPVEGTCPNKSVLNTLDRSIVAGFACMELNVERCRGVPGLSFSGTSRYNQLYSINESAFTYVRIAMKMFLALDYFVY